jgi:hypothetical protein
MCDDLPGHHLLRQQGAVAEAQAPESWQHVGASGRIGVDEDVAVDPSFDSTQGSGATDGASLRQRMHFIADLFRTRQEVASLLGPPFSPEQAIAIKAHRRPAGRL